MRYRMLAVDLDGTLLNPHGQVSRGNRDAIARARDAGMLIVPCTGRGWRESLAVLKQLYDGVADDVAHEATDDPMDEPDDLAAVDCPGVFVTGAAVCDVRTGRSLDLAVIEPHLALRLVEAMADLPEAVLVFRDSSMAGHDYLVTGAGELTPNTRWWFNQWRARVHHQPRVGVEQMHHALRVGVVARRSRMPVLEARLRPQFGDQVFFHHFEALQQPAPAESMHIFEVFAAGVDKWRGIEWVAREHGIAPAEVVAIGDEINDVAMLLHAGCGIAMGNAIPAARAAARYVTRPNSEDGVAHAVDRLLEGQWG